MSNIDKQALREIAVAAVGAHERLSVMPPDDIFDISLAEGTKLDADITALNALNSAANPATMLELLDELEDKDKCISELKSAVKSANESYENRTPTQWAYDQACLAIEKHRTRADSAEKRIAEQREIMRQAASDISYAIFNLTGSDLSRLNPGVVETTDPTDTALIAERNLRAAAVGKGE